MCAFGLVSAPNTKTGEQVETGILKQGRDRKWLVSCAPGCAHSHLRGHSRFHANVCLELGRQLALMFWLFA